MPYPVPQNQVSSSYTFNKLYEYYPAYTVTKQNDTVVSEKTYYNKESDYESVFPDKSMTG